MGKQANKRVELKRLKREKFENSKKPKEEDAPAPAVAKTNGTNGDASTPKKPNRAKRGETNGDASTPKKPRAKRGKKAKGVPAVAVATSNEEKEKKNDNATAYLNQWKNDYANWRFNKNIQNWLINNIFISNRIPDDNFDTVISYFEGCTGGARARLESSAMNKIKQYEKMDKLEEEDQCIMDRAQRVVKMGVSERKRGGKLKNEAEKQEPANKKGKAEETPNKTSPPAKAKTPQAGKMAAKADKKTPQKSAKKSPAKKV